METQIFFQKMILNALQTWTGTFADDSLMRCMLDRHENLHGEWTKELEEKKKQYFISMGRSETDSFFVPWDKIVDRDFIQKMVDEITGEFPALLQPYEVSQNARVLSELMELTAIESLLLDSAIRIQTGISYSFEYTIGRFKHMDSMIEPDKMLSVVFNVPREDARDAMEGFLMQSGILTTKNAPTGFYSLNQDIAQAFTMSNLTVENVEDALFPAMIKTKLGTGDYPHLEKEIARTRSTVDKSLATNAEGTNILLWGPPGTGKSELTLAMAEEFGWNLRVIGDISNTDTSEKSRTQRLASLKMAAKVLARDPRAVLLFDEMEDLFKVDNSAAFSKAFLNRIIETTTVPIIWTTNSLMVLGDATLRRMVYNVHLDIPPAKARKHIWSHYCQEFNLKLGEDALNTLADTYDIAPALIRNAVKVASASQTEGEQADSEVVIEIISSMDTMMRYGDKRVFKKPNRDEEVTYDPSCSNTDRDLGDFVERLKNAKPNISMLFYGVSGTGKSELGRYIAKQLGREVLYKKASDILSMWVGGTEKNLAEVFADASRDRKVLIIDEGDTFLQNRGKAQRSWEVTQVNQMLAEMENHDQPFVLTTNLKDDLDPAAMRRFTFKLKFDYITPTQAKKLFVKFFGVEAPREIEREHMLAPGDFANVKKQVEALGIENEREIFNMLIEEVRQKPSSGAPIGF